MGVVHDILTQSDGVDRGPFLGGDVVADEDGRSRDDFSDADGVEHAHVDVDAPRSSIEKPQAIFENGF